MAPPEDQPRRRFLSRLTPEWLAVSSIFIWLYAPFLLRFGWEFRHIANTDLPSFYAAAIVTFRASSSPYDQALLDSVFPNGLVYPYLYPPSTLVLFWPLSLVPYTKVRLAMLALNHMLFLGVVWMVPLRLLRIRPNRGTLGLFAFCLVYMLTFHPVLVNLYHGQLNLILLAALLLFWLLASANRHAPAGFFLAIAVLLKTYPLAFVPLLIMIGHRRTAGYTIGWLATVIAASVVALPDGLWREWRQDMLPTGGYGMNVAGLLEPASMANQSLNGLFARLFIVNEWSPPLLVSPALAQWLTGATSLIVALVTVFFVWRSRHASDRIDLMMLVSLPALYLIAPLSWEHHLVYLLPLPLLLLHRANALGSPGRAVYCGIVLSAAALIGMPGILPLRILGVIALWALALHTIGKIAHPYVEPCSYGGE